MDVPGVVTEALGDEEIHAHVSLGGAGVDALYVTPTRTIVYEDEGLISDESAREIDHGAERITVSEGRRKATIRLSYGLDDDSEVVVPTRQVDEALHPILAGVLAATDIIDDGEGVRESYRFSELTLVVTSDRVLKHVGSAVWDADEYEELLFADVLDVGLEEGSVSTQLVLETADRQERIKTPSDSARQVYADVEDALLAFHGVTSYEEFREAVAPDAEAEEAGETSDLAESGLDPISTADTEDAPPEEDADVASVKEADAGGTPEDAAATAETESADSATGAGGADPTDAGTPPGEATDDGASDEGFEDSPFEPAAERQSPDPEVIEAELRALDEALARQADLIEEQRAAIEALVDELGLD